MLTHLEPQDPKKGKKWKTTKHRKTRNFLAGRPSKSNTVHLPRTHGAMNSCSSPSTYLLCIKIYNHDEWHVASPSPKGCSHRLSNFHGNRKYHAKWQIQVLLYHQGLEWRIKQKDNTKTAMPWAERPAPWNFLLPHNVDVRMHQAHQRGYRCCTNSAVQVPPGIRHIQCPNSS